MAHQQQHKAELDQQIQADRLTPFHELTGVREVAWEVPFDQRYHSTVVMGYCWLLLQWLIPVKKWSLKPDCNYGRCGNSTSC